MAITKVTSSLTSFDSLLVDSDNTDTTITVESDLDGSSLFTSGIDLRREGVSKGSRVESIRDASVGGVGLNFLTTADNAAEVSGTLTSRMQIDHAGTVAIGTTPSVHMFTVSTNTSGILAANFVNSNTGGFGVNISAGSGTNYVLRAENYAGGTLWQINADGNMCHGFTDDIDGANYSTYSNNSNGIAIGSGGGTNQYRRIYHTSSSGIMSFKSSSNTASLSNAGAWTNASDRAYKENIKDIEYGLSTVEALQPRKFDMIDDGSHEIGFIAQEVEELIPEVVTGEEGTKGIGYGQLTAVLTKAIQELKAELDAAKERITELENS